MISTLTQTKQYSAENHGVMDLPIHTTLHTYAAKYDPNVDSSEKATAGLESLRESLEGELKYYEDQVVLKKFVRAAVERASSSGITEDWSLSSVSRAASIDLSSINRDSPLYSALWISWLTTTARHLDKTCLRYQTLEEFLSVYSHFGDYNESEQYRLMHTANWMSYLFEKIPAKKNKGLAISLIPKLVEGWNARYVTGSGQTKCTADRVHIYEVEGGIQPYQRVKLNKRRKPKKDSQHVKRQRVGQHPMTAGVPHSYATSLTLERPEPTFTHHTSDSGGLFGVPQDFIFGDLFESERLYSSWTNPCYGDMHSDLPSTGSSSSTCQSAGPLILGEFDYETSEDLSHDLDLLFTEEFDFDKL